MCSRGLMTFFNRSGSIHLSDIQYILYREDIYICWTYIAKRLPITSFCSLTHTTHTCTHTPTPTPHTHPHTHTHTTHTHTPHTDTIGILTHTQTLQCFGYVFVLYWPGSGSGLKSDSFLQRWPQEEGSMNCGFSNTNKGHEVRLNLEAVETLWTRFGGV